MKKIVVITDCKDVAFNEIRGMLLKHLKHAKEEIIIEPIVPAEEFSVINGAFLTRLVAEIYDPKTTIFLVILNPLNTTRKDRARIIGETKNGFKFVGANTGTLNWLIKDFGIKRLYELKREKLTGENFVSFGGKYIHSPAAAKIALGTDFSELGEEKNIEFLTDFQILKGQVVHIDNFGVPKINGDLKNFKEGEILNILLNDKKIISAKYTNSMKDLPDGTWAIYPGSSLNNLPELGKVREKNSAQKLGIKIGDIIKFEANTENPIDSTIS